MSLERRHPDSSAARALTAFAYAALVTLVPVQHAQQEAVVSAQSIEPNHTDECPRLHTGPACLVAALSLLATPTVGPRFDFVPPWVDNQPADPLGSLHSSSFHHTHRSRAPPPLT